MKRTDFFKTTGMTRRELVRNYLVFLKSRDNAYFIDSLVHENPEAAWPLVVELIQRAPDDHLGDLGAGLLENLLSFHGPKFIERVEARAKKDKRFRIALRGTWGHTRMSKRVYERKEKACADIPPY